MNDNLATRFAYDPDDRLGSATDPDGRTEQYGYDRAGRLVSRTLPNGETIEIDRLSDPQALPIAVSFADDSWTLQFDALRRLVRVADPAGRALAFDHDARGYLTEAVNEATSVAFLYDYDPLGNLTSVTDPNGDVETADYGNDRLLDSMTDAAGNTTQYVRDDNDRITQVGYGDGATVDIEYDQIGRARAWIGSDGSSNALDRTPEGVIVGGVDLVIGRTATRNVSDSNGIQVSYDDNDRVRRMTFADGAYVEYEYDGRGNVTRMTDSIGGATTITWTDIGKIDTIFYPNGQSVDYDYDRAGRVTRIDYAGLGAIAITRGVFGQIETVENSLPVPDDIPAIDRRFGYTSGSRQETALYDARGNQVGRGFYARRWDLQNRLVETDDGEETTILGYDALGQLTRESRSTGEIEFVQNYSLRQPRASIERDTDGNVRWIYVHMLDGRLMYRFNAAGERQYYQFDERGNTILLTDNGGNVLNAYNTAPHGEVVASVENVANDLTTGAQFGWRELDDSGTIGKGLQYIDTRSGHHLNDPGFFQAAGALVTAGGITSNTGRSVTVGAVAGLDNAGVFAGPLMPDRQPSVFPETGLTGEQLAAASTAGSAGVPSSYADLAEGAFFLAKVLGTESNLSDPRADNVLKAVEASGTSSADSLGAGPEPGIDVPALTQRDAQLVILFALSEVASGRRSGSILPLLLLLLLQDDGSEPQPPPPPSILREVAQSPVIL